MSSPAVRALDPARLALKKGRRKPGKPPVGSRPSAGTRGLRQDCRRFYPPTSSGPVPEQDFQLSSSLHASREVFFSVYFNEPPLEFLRINRRVRQCSKAHEPGQERPGEKSPFVPIVIVVPAVLSIRQAKPRSTIAR